MEGQIPEVERALAALYGTHALLERGVSHVAAVAERGGELRVLRVGEADAPKSATDFFVLNACRARADAVLTSAANLRAEPHLQHDLAGPEAAELARYRLHLGKRAPLVCAILTRSCELPLAHPVWRDGAQKWVLSTREPPDALRTALPQVRFVRFDELDARRACAFLHAQGLALVSIEAGPSTSRTLYGAPEPMIEELLLSRYEGGADVPLGGALPSEAELRRSFVCVGESVREEASGPWRFQRWLRQPTNLSASSTSPLLPM